MEQVKRRMTYIEQLSVLESWICAWEPVIYRGRDKRATYTTKGPEEVGLKASMLPVLVPSFDDGDVEIPGAPSDRRGYISLPGSSGSAPRTRGDPK
jgi:hypothetical protein